LNLKTCIDVVYDDLGRVYVFDDNSRYHSVTTMLNNTANKDGIRKWRVRVGDEEADRISRTASHMGEQFHLLGEYYLKGIDCVPYVNPISRHIFNTTTKPILDAHVTNVISVEEVLYSIALKLAGRTDAVLEWDHKLSIFDFKLLNNSDKKWLSDYWIQTTIYAHCWKEMYGVMPEQLVLVIGNKNTLDSTYYTSRINPHIAKMNYRSFQFNSILEQRNGQY
jgi:hypothetical protein